MSDVAINALQQRIEALTAQVTTLNAEAKDRRIANRKLKTELDGLKTQHQAVTAERDALKTKSEAAPGELQTRIAELEGQIATRDHTDAFTKALSGFKAKPGDGPESEYGLNAGATLADVWQALQYAPKGDTPDGTRAAELLGQALKAKPYLFAPKTVETTTAAPGGAQTAIRTPATPPGPGASRSTETATAPPASARSQVDQQFAATGKSNPGRIA